MSCRSEGSHCIYNTHTHTQVLTNRYIIWDGRAKKGNVNENAFFVLSTVFVWLL